MSEHAGLPAAVDANALLALAEDHHERDVHPLDCREISGHLVKVYALEAPGRTVTEQDEAEAVRIAEGHLALGAARGSLGLAVLIVHAGGDGDYVLVHTWIEGNLSDLGIFTGPAERPDLLRPARAGLAPCVWEAEVLAHERDVFAWHVLDGDGELSDRVAAWAEDVFEGASR
ncbi:hypothetical protein BJF83_21090 [Nocardiopsis sp. CNR-923]|uniref:hypothetical protein n=1 Tax=Nocardiopsis sp. CNR-923 TaxID=1904965 RepID=UPI00095BBB16|nr:hypothetical protein [Nocardiopsis sp. CNR-923]OLT26506.1 hypothetical protein BJF83_21090 [Nocardiopsis sp. CNR-923]